MPKGVYDRSKSKPPVFTKERAPRKDKGVPRPHRQGVPNPRKAKVQAEIKVRKTRSDKGLGRNATGMTVHELQKFLKGAKDGITDYDCHTVPPPPPRFPEHHQLWSRFVTWVETGGVVRSDLLNCHPQSLSGNDWEQVWKIWLAGASSNQLPQPSI